MCELLTYKVQLTGEAPEQALTLQNKHDAEVGAQRAPHTHMVNDCPEASVQGNLNTGHEKKKSMDNRLYSRKKTYSICGYRK